MAIDDSSGGRQKEDTYTVFCRFRSRKLRLASSLPLDLALERCPTLNRLRFHNREEVFVVHDRTGDVVVTDEVEAPTPVEASHAPPAGPRQRLERALRRGRKLLVGLRRTMSGDAENASHETLAIFEECMS